MLSEYGMPDVLIEATRLAEKYMAKTISFCFTENLATNREIITIIKTNKLSHSKDKTSPPLAHAREGVKDNALIVNSLFIHLET